MSDYRLYFLSRNNGHIMRFVEFTAPDDDSAVAEAMTNEGENPLELWSGARKVERIEANDPTSRIVRRWREQREERVAAE